MIRVNINGTIYEAPNIIQIKNGCLIVEDQNIGLIGYECCIKTIDGSVNYEGSTITWTNKN